MAPRRCAPHASVTSLVEGSDIVFADDDGSLFAAAKDVDDLLRVAHEIWDRERHQAEAIKSGRSLREQLAFTKYLEKRAAIRVIHFGNTCKK